MRTIAEAKTGMGWCRATLLPAIAAFILCIVFSSTWPGDAEASEEAWRAGGHEPSWSLLRIGGEMTLETDFGATKVSFAVPPAKPVDDKTVAYMTVVNGEALQVSVKTQICVDTMTGMPRPEIVVVTLGKTRLTGCGGDPSSLLRRREWVVAEIAGQPTLDKPLITLSFDTFGRLSGLASCNRFGADYTLTGEGLSIAKSMTSMMACEEPIMEQEQRFLELLRRVSRFSIGVDGALSLHTDDNRSIKTQKP